MDLNGIQLVPVPGDATTPTAEVKYGLHAVYINLVIRQHAFKYLGKGFARLDEKCDVRFANDFHDER